MTPAEFSQNFMPYAQRVSQRTGLDPRLVLAQAALETGYGRSAPNNNYFGIKSHGKSGGSNLMTKEFEGGRMVSKPQSFRGYADPSQSFEGYADFILSNPRYKKVLGQSGLSNQIAAMGESGYATDPKYASKLRSIANRFGADMPTQPIQPATVSTQGTAPMMQQEEETPRGLLGGLGIQKMQEGAAGETGQRFYERDSFKDTAALLAQGFGRMGIMGMEEIADGIAKQRTEDKAKNKTVEYLRKSGRSDLADAVESGSLGAREAAGLLFAKPKDDSTALMKNYEFYISKGMSPEQAMAAVKSGTTINTGDALKVLSDGRVLMSDPEAPDGYRVITPPGSKAATEAAQSEARDESRESSGSIMGQNVIQTAARVRELISPRSVGYGSLLKTLPESDARELQKEVDALGAIASSENLNLMRQESPTGGALGNVSDRDIQLLKDKSGAIDPGSKPEVFRQQVDEYELFLLQTIHGEKAGRQIFDQTRPPPAPQSAAPVTFSPADVALVKKYSSPPKTEEQ